MLYKNRLRIYKAGFANSLITFSIFYSFFLQIPFLMVFVFCALCAILIYKFVNNGGVDRDSLLIFFLIFLLILPGLFNPDKNFQEIFYFFSELVIVFLAWETVKNRELFFLSMKFLFYSFLVLALGALFVYWGENEPYSHVIEGSSQNGIPSYLIVLAATYCFFCLLVHRELPVFSIFLVCVVAFFGEGRGSIISSFLLLVICYFRSLFFSEKNNFSKFIGFVFLAAVLVWCALNIMYIYDFVATRSKISVGLADQHRVDILRSYVSSMGFWEFFVGGSYVGTVIDDVYSNNPHISYVRLHHFFGVFALFFVVFSPFLMFYRGISWRRVFLFSLVCVILLRAATEPILFPTFLDYFYMSMFFAFFQYMKNPPIDF